MSRAYKQRMIDNYLDMGGTGSAADLEQLSGADLAQMILSIEQVGTGVTVTSNANGAVKNTPVVPRSGQLATVTADGVNTVTVDSTASLSVGQIIDIWNTSSTSQRVNDRTITAIDFNTKIVTYNGADASAAIVAGDFLVTSVQANSAALTGADLNYFSGLS